MKLRQLKKSARGQIESIGRAKIRFSKEALWHWMLFTNHGRHPLDESVDLSELIFSRNPFQDNPWARRLNCLRPSVFSPRVLIIGTVAQLIGLNTSQSVPDLMSKHGIGQADREYSNRISTFWEHFYGAWHFFDYARQIPSLIITTGETWGYPDVGGEKLNVNDRLRQIARIHQIPIEFIGL